MPRTTPLLPESLARSLETWGADLLAARRAQGRSAEHVALAAGITRKTLQRVERGDPAVALGIYVRVLDALGLMGNVAAKTAPPRSLRSSPAKAAAASRERAGGALVLDASTQRPRRSHPQPQTLRRDPRSLDARSLAMHRSIAAKIRRQPALLDRARATIDRWQTQGAAQASRPYLEAWRALIDQGLEATLAAAVDPGERGNAMRQASPFTGILDNRERWALLRGREA